MDLQELINDYLEGKLSPEDRRLFESLIADNPKYKAELIQQEKGRAAVDLFEQSARRRPASLKSWLFSAAIACVLVLCGYLLWITLGMSPGEKLYAKYYQTPPNQVAKSTLGTDEINLKTEAFQAFDANDFEKAAALFERISLQGDSDYLLLYHGICQLELGRPEKAIPLLNRVGSDSDTASKEVAAWFAAMGYFKLNMLDKGKQSLQVTASNANPYQVQAKTILESLK